MAIVTLHCYRVIVMDNSTNSQLEPGIIIIAVIDLLSSNRNNSILESHSQTYDVSQMV